MAQRALDFSRVLAVEMDGVIRDLERRGRMGFGGEGVSRHLYIGIEEDYLLIGVRLIAVRLPPVLFKQITNMI